MKKKLAIIVPIIIVLLIAALGIGYGISKNNDANNTEVSAPITTETPTQEPTAEPTATPTAEPTATPEPTPTPTPEPTATPEPTPTPTPEPTATPEPTPEPTPVVTAEPLNPGAPDVEGYVQTNKLLKKNQWAYYYTDENDGKSYLYLDYVILSCEGEKPVYTDKTCTTTVSYFRAGYNTFITGFNGIRQCLETGMIEVMDAEGYTGWITPDGVKVGW